MSRSLAHSCRIEKRPQSSGLQPRKFIITQRTHLLKAVCNVEFGIRITSGNWRNLAESPGFSVLPWGLWKAECGRTSLLAVKCAAGWCHLSPAATRENADGHFRQITRAGVQVLLRIPGPQGLRPPNPFHKNLISQLSKGPQSKWECFVGKVK